MYLYRYVPLLCGYGRVHLGIYEYQYDHGIEEPINWYEKIMIPFKYRYWVVSSNKKDYILMKDKETIEIHNQKDYVLMKDKETMEYIAKAKR